jgi:diguanylate cyclase (GGDEF)-like protein
MDFDARLVQGLPIVAGAVGLGAGVLVARLRRLRAEADMREVERRCAKDRERALVAERELAAERARIGPLTEGRRHLLATLSRAYQDLGSVRDARGVAEALGHAVERLFDPAQVMVFVAVDDEAKEFDLAVSGGARLSTWPQGARLNETMGRLGLVARRRTTMDRGEFDLEPPIVREQLATSEPASFLVDVAAPVVVAGSVVAIVSVGGSTMPVDATRSGLELLAAHAAAVLRGLAASARIERLWSTDELTGLGSKSWFVAEGDEAIYRCRGARRNAALALLGVDDFKDFVERAGHGPADHLLRRIAEVVKANAGDGALVARWSGAEFAVLLPATTRHDARAVVERLRAAVAAAEWPDATQQPRGRLTMSAGLAVTPHDAGTLDALIERAADSLAAARWSGDRTCTPSDEAPTVEAPVSGSRESEPVPSR